MDYKKLYPFNHGKTLDQNIREKVNHMRKGYITPVNISCN